MAWTTTKQVQYAAGDVYVQLWDLTADAATLELNTGLQYILHVQHSAQSITSAGFKVKRNELSAATASNGTIALTGCASGDNIFLAVWGR
jgi:hypothetical protein